MICRTCGLALVPIARSVNQISQSAEPNALSKPPNALSRQGSVLPAALRRSEVEVRLTSAFFGFDFGAAALVTFFGLGSCRRRLITLGGSDGPTLVPSGIELRSSKRDKLDDVRSRKR